MVMSEMKFKKLCSWTLWKDHLQKHADRVCRGQAKWERHDQVMQVFDAFNFDFLVLLQPGSLRKFVS
jgi:hypothetical protein